MTEAKTPEDVYMQLHALEAEIRKRAEKCGSIAETGGLRLMAEGVRWARQNLVDDGGNSARTWRTNGEPDAEDD